MGRISDFLFGPATAVASTQVPFPVFPVEEENSLIQTLIVGELFNGENAVLTREGALQVGGVKKGRALICGAVADAPLFAYKGDEKLAKQPTWAYRTDAGTSPWHTWSMVLDDFIFYDKTLLAFELGADGYPVDIVRVRYNRWSQDGDGTVRIDGQAVDPKLVMVVPGPGAGGLLTTGAADVKAARALARARAARAIAPVPLVELHQLTEDELEQEEIDALVDGWSAARAANGGVGFTDNRVEVRVHGDKTVDFYENAINASRTDIANHLNIPAALLDGTPNTASLTYETREGQAQVMWDSTIPYWLGPLEAALSSDRVVPRGQKVRFDLTAKRGPVPTPAIAGPDIED